MLKWISAIFWVLIFPWLPLDHQAAFAKVEEIPISILEGVEEEDPVVGWDGTNFLVVWQTNRKDPNDYNVYAARVNSEGRVLDPQGILISNTPSNQIFIDVAWGKGVYLVVWQDLRSRQRWEIYGARLQPGNTALDSEGIPIAIGERNARHPQVAWDGENFIVVWMEENEGRGWDVAGARISPDGKVLDGERILIATGHGDQAHPAVAWGKDHYLVVWMEHPPDASHRISGVRVSSSGKVLDSESLALSLSSANPGFPAVAWGKGQFVVVWADHPTDAVYTLSGVRVSRAGRLVDSEEFVVAQSSNLHTFPSVRCGGEECLVVWEEDQSQGRPMQGIGDIIRDVRGAFLDLSKPAVVPTYIMIAPKAIGNHFAKVASNSRDYLVVWKDYRAGTAASLGRLVRSR